MRIRGIGAATVGAASRYSSAGTHEPDASESRALIALEPATQRERSLPLTRRPAAPFLAQLIATQMHVPQTRERCRAEPAEAAAVYAARFPPATTSRVFTKRV